MTKHLKNLAVFLLAAVMLMAGAVTAYAESGVENPYIETIRGASVMGSSPVIFRDTSTGMPAYCIDYNRGIPDPESLSGEFDPMTIFDPDTYRGLEYLLLAGYPFETGGLSDTEAQACTQLAVWCWTGETLGYGLNADNYHATNGREDIYEYFIGLMEAARNQIPPDIGIDCADTQMLIDGDTLTGTTTVALRNLDGYAIDESVLPAGIVISGYTGSDGDVIAFTASLDYAGETIDIENLFTGQDTRSALNLFWYDNSNPNQQRMVISYYDETTTAIAVGLSLQFAELPEPECGYIKLIKSDSDTELPLAGAVFGVYDAVTDEKVCELISGADGTAVSPLLPIGDYYLKELTAPEQYLLSEDTISVTVIANETVEVSAVNTKIPTPDPEPTEGKIKLIKKDDDSGKLLAGAVFGVYRAFDDVKVCELETTSRGEAVSPLLPEGDYYLKELKSPDNYILSTEKYGVTVKADKTVEITITNTKKADPTPNPDPTPTPEPTPSTPAPTPNPSDPTGELVLLKKAEQTGNPLADAIFGVYSISGNQKVAELTTNLDGRAAVNLPAGEYYLLELKAPYGYLVEKTKIFFTVVNDSTVTVEVTNQRDETIEEVPLIEIPKTGESVPYGNYIAGSMMLLLSLAGGLLIYKRKRVV